MFTCSGSCSNINDSLVEMGEDDLGGASVKINKQIEIYILKKRDSTPSPMDTPPPPPLGYCGTQLLTGMIWMKGSIYYINTDI